jgi:hypothetical protein
MQFSTIASALLALLPLVAGDACVVSGPSSIVTADSYCCKRVGGTWYQFYAVQAICVMDASNKDAFSRCVKYIEGSNPTCIPGNGGDLTNPTLTTITDSPPRTTIVA